MKIKIKNKQVLVDQEDASLLQNKSWYIAHGYVSRQLNVGGKQYQHRLHREILGLKPYSKKEVDHINGNKLDNRKSNLRVCKREENIRNRGVYKNNKLRIKGVSYKKSLNKYIAQIQYDGIVYHIGVFKDQHEAGYVYEQFAKQLFGKYSRTNLL